jgi:hypothetical protein
VLGLLIGRPFEKRGDSQLWGSETICAVADDQRTITASAIDWKTVTAAEKDQKRSRQPTVWRIQTLKGREFELRMGCREI